MKKPIPFGKYLLLERINVGGMAEVFLAKVSAHADFDHLLAIKKILPTMVEDEEFITMFLDEARISVQLNHPNVVQIHELGKLDENFYIAMDYVAGKDLRTLVERYRRRKEIMPTAMAVFLGIKMAEGLDYAHKKKDAAGVDLNIVHRDVSPQNILISYDGQVKIIDFGIAKAANRAQKTQAGILKGKFGYMSPEQVRGLPIDRRSDIFALGVVLFEMLTGEKLFIGESDFSTLEKVRNAEVPSPRQFNGNIPPALEKVMYKALAREVEDRYQWGGDLAEDLTRFLNAGETLYGPKQLASFMGEAFAEDVMRERKRIEAFAALELPRPVDDGPVSGSGPTARGVGKYTTPGKLPAAQATTEPPLPSGRPPGQSGQQPIMSSRGVMRAAAPAPEAQPVGRRSTGGAGTPAVDPVAAALAELDGPTFQPGQMKVPAEFAQPPPPKPPRGSPKSVPAHGDPNNPYIPPPSAEEMAEMGTSDRTEIFKPAFQSGPVALEAPRGGFAPMARDVTDSSEGGMVNGSESGESNATMIGPASSFEPPATVDENGPTMMMNGHSAPEEEPPKPVNGRRPPGASLGKMKAALPREEPPDQVETKAQNLNRGAKRGFEPDVPEERTSQMPEPAPKGPGRGRVPAAPPPPDIEPASADSDDDAPARETTGEEAVPADGDLSDATGPVPPKGKGGSTKVVLIVMGTAIGVVLLAVTGYFAFRALLGPPMGAVIVTVDPADPAAASLVAQATVYIDEQPVQVAQKVSVTPGIHQISLKVGGQPSQSAKVTIEKDLVLPVAFKLEAPKPAPEEKKPDEKAPEQPKPEEKKPDALANPEVKPDAKKPDEKAPDQPKPVAKTFTLSVTSDPDGAEVTIGKSHKKTPADFTELEKSKAYPLKIVLKGYAADPDTPKQVRWADGDDPQKLAITLVAVAKPAPKAPKAAVAPVEHKKAPKGDSEAPVAAKASAKGPKGTLIISSKPVAKVYIDGKDTGQWTPIPPARALSLVAGPHTVKLDDGKGLSASVPVTIVADQQFRLLGVELSQ